MSLIDSWVDHLKAKLGRDPTIDEFRAAVLPDGKTCREPIWERGKSRSEMPVCGKPATGWTTCMLAGVYPICADCDPRFLGLPASRFRPASFEPGFWENM